MTLAHLNYKPSYHTLNFLYQRVKVLELNETSLNSCRFILGIERFQFIYMFTDFSFELRRCIDKYWQGISCQLVFMVSFKIPAEKGILRF